MPRTSDEWWDEPTPNSRLKTRIVSKYADTWAGIITSASPHQPHINYVDVYAGRGHYRNGEAGTALSVMNHWNVALNKKGGDRLRNRCRVYLNDKNPEYARELRDAANSGEFTNLLQQDPTVWTHAVDPVFLKSVSGNISGPALWLIDPWGYGGVTRELIQGCTDSWGCDALLLLNVSALTRSSQNEQEFDSLSQFFGPNYFQELRSALQVSHPGAKENLVLSSALKSYKKLGGGRFVSRVGFKFQDRDRNSHFLFLITKHPTAVIRFNGIIEKELEQSQPDAEGIYIFDSRRKGQAQIELIAKHDFEERFSRQLLSTFAGRSMRFDRLHIETIELDFQVSEPRLRNIVLRLETEEAVQVSLDRARTPRAGKLPLPKDSMISFPR